MTLTFELDLDILPLDLNTEIQLFMSARLAVRVVTHRHTQRHTHTDDVKTFTPNTSQMWGVIIVLGCFLILKEMSCFRRCFGSYTPDYKDKDQNYSKWNNMLLCHKLSIRPAHLIWINQ